MRYKGRLSFLKRTRRRSKLTQGDISFIAGLTNTVTISRYETGERIPPTDILLIYHILFDQPIATLLPDYVESVRATIRKRCEELQGIIENGAPEHRNKQRLAYLSATVSRLKPLKALTTTTEHEQ